MKWTSKNTGFTLVELLVVITIIGILIALLLPAVQAARESARRVQCTNNLKQMALACLQHEQANHYLPSGGWGWVWGPDSDRGFGKKQPGGWHFSILPYMELGSLHDMSMGQNYLAITKMIAIPVNTFYCPSRRNSIVTPYTCGTTGGAPYTQIRQFPTSDYPNTAKTDYAANGGDGPCAGSNPNVPGSGTPPGCYASADGMSDAKINHDYLWGNQHPTGVIFAYSQCKMADITDGASNTLLIGEKYINPDYYFNGTDGGDDAGWASGYDYDVDRWVVVNNVAQRPIQDTPGVGGGLDLNFGGAHANSLNMAFCDGAVQGINYSVDSEVWHCLGNREDGLPVEPTKY